MAEAPPGGCPVRPSSASGPGALPGEEGLTPHAPSERGARVSRRWLGHRHGHGHGDGHGDRHRHGFG